jgi:long-chain fatty acid transport protein
MKRILGILAIGAALVATPAYATNGMRLIGFGPIQVGMGGASVAAPLDAVTAATNPAGLSALGTQVELGGAALNPTVKYSQGGQSITSSRPTDFLPTLAGVYKVQDQLTLGFAALGTAGMGVDYKYGPAMGNAEFKTSYMNGRVAPAAAYKVNDQLSVGLAMNLMYAQMGFGMFIQSPPIGQVSPTPANSFGYGATIGVTYKATDMLTVGAAYETQSYFQDFSFDVMGQTFKIKMDQPMIATLGVGVRPVEGLLLALDGQWINWSATNGKNKPEISPSNPVFAFNMNWSDQFVAKLGAQYQIPALKELKVRAGFEYGKSPVDKEQVGETMLFPAIAAMHYTVGAGYDIGPLAVNAAFLYSPEAKLSGTGWETTMTQMEFQLGATYKF